MKWILNLMKQLAAAFIGSGVVMLMLHVLGITLWKGMLGVGILVLTVGLLGTFGGDVTISGFMSNASAKSGAHPQAAYPMDLTGPRRFTEYERSNKQLDLNFAIILIFIGLFLTIAGFYIESLG